MIVGTKTVVCPVGLVTAVSILAACASPASAPVHSDILPPGVQTQVQRMDEGNWTLSPPPAGSNPHISAAQAVRMVKLQYHPTRGVTFRATLVSLTTEAKVAATGHLLFDHVLTWVVDVEGIPFCPMGGPLIQSSSASPLCGPGHAFVAINARSGHQIERYETAASQR